MRELVPSYSKKLFCRAEFLTGYRENIEGKWSASSPDAMSLRLNLIYTCFGSCVVLRAGRDIVSSILAVIR